MSDFVPKCVDLVWNDPYAGSGKQASCGRWVERIYPLCFLAGFHQTRLCLSSVLAQLSFEHFVLFTRATFCCFILFVCVPSLGCSC